MDENDKRNQSGGMFGRTTDEFSVRSASSGVGWDVGDVPPVFPCYIGVDDQLQIEYAGNAGGLTLNVNVRILGLDGLIHPLQFNAPGSSNRTASVTRFNLMEGWLLSCSAIAVANIQTQQWGYANVGLVRAPFGQTQVYDVLVSGYLSNRYGLAYPMSGYQRPLDGAGVSISFNQAAPAAGADLVITVPTNARWRLVSFRATLTTAVTVANRDVSLVIDDGANIFAESPSNLVLVASSANTYCWFDSATLLGTPFNNRTVAPLPSLNSLQRAWRVSTQTTGIQAADQWSAAQANFIEWYDDTP